MEYQQLGLLPQQITPDLDLQLKRLGLSPHPCGVGKRMPFERYVHRSAEDALPQELLTAARERLPDSFHYAVVKHHEQRCSLSFIASPNWDESPEPLAGESYCVYPDGPISHRSATKRSQIYHHRWLFVRPDYQGFDVIAAKQRSLMYLTLKKKGIIACSQAKIGYLDIWGAEVLPILETYLASLYS